MRRLVLAATLALTMGIITSTTIVAQARSAAAPTSVVGTWVGTVDLADGSQVIEVEYSFAKEGDTWTGSATAVGQGTGPVTRFVQDGMKLSWTVSIPTGEFFHQGEISADGKVIGTISLDGTAVASFTIARKKM